VLPLTVKFYTSQTHSKRQKINTTNRNLELPINMSIKVGNYLFIRLKQLGISTVFGVPGGE